ncbi:lyso-ornithine lipid O-acyltransferase [Albidovulum sp.]
MTAWRGVAEEEARRPLGAVGLGLAIARGLPLALLVYGGLALLLLLRLAEAPLCGQARPVTPHLTRLVCRGALRLLGLPLHVTGRPMQGRGALVANHASWLDIFVLNACQTVYFVAKAEVARWPLIGWLARATGTVFIARDPRQAKAQQALLEARIRADHRLLFFPEGTSSDGRRVLPFKPTLFAAFYSHGLDHVMRIQPVTVIYHPPAGQPPRFYGWWGEMDFAPHLLKVLAAPRQGRVEVVFHPPVAVDAFASRKALALHCEEAVRGALESRLAAGPSGR